MMEGEGIHLEEQIEKRVIKHKNMLKKKKHTQTHVWAGV